MGYLIKSLKIAKIIRNLNELGNLITNTEGSQSHISILDTCVTTLKEMRHQMINESELETDLVGIQLKAIRNEINDTNKLTLKPKSLPKYTHMKTLPNCLLQDEPIESTSIIID